MSPAKPADPQIPNSIRERTDCTSSLATHADPDEVSLLSRPVSLHKSARDADNKVRGLGGMAALGIFSLGSHCRSSSMHNEDWLGRMGRGLHLMMVYKKTYTEDFATVSQEKLRDLSE